MDPHHSYIYIYMYLIFQILLLLSFFTIYLFVLSNNFCIIKSIKKNYNFLAHLDFSKRNRYKLIFNSIFFFDHIIKGPVESLVLMKVLSKINFWGLEFQGFSHQQKSYAKALIRRNLRKVRDPLSRL